ncbi:hypothetical protein BDR26DRAFT_808528, partial [Obelidium mucronatum]
MPRKSERQQLLSRLLLTLKHTTVLEVLINHCNPLKEFQYDVLLMLYAIQSSRYLWVRTPIPKQLGYRYLLRQLPAKEVRQALRMDIESFGKLVELIEDDPIFQNQSQNPQTEVWIQLATALERIGSNGSGGVLNLSVVLGIGAGTVVLFCRRVVQAILRLKSRCMLWPSRSTRRALSNRMHQEFGLRGLVGIVDGTDIVLHQKPCVDPEVYWT